MLEEFPFLHVSPQPAHSMWSKQARQVSALLRSDSETKRSKTQRMIDEAERRQESLVKILKKELEHNQRMVGRVFMIATVLIDNISEWCCFLFRICFYQNYLVLVPSPE